MLSDKSRKILISGLANKVAAIEIADAIDSGSNSAAATVAAIPASANLSVLVVAPSAIADSAMVAAIPAEPTSAEVDVAIDALRDSVAGVLDIKADNADVETLRGEIETRMDAVESKINAILVALKNAGLML